MKGIAKLIGLLFISSLNFNLILNSMHIVTGGGQGLAIIISSVVGKPPGVILFLLNIIMLIISFLFLSKKTTNGILLISFLYPLFINLTAFTTNIINHPNILIIILSGLISGAVLGSILKMGYSTGGLNVLTLVLKKYFNIKEYSSVLLINSSIIFLGLFIFGIRRSLYGLLIIIINSMVVRFLLGDVKNCKIK